MGRTHSVCKRPSRFSIQVGSGDRCVHEEDGNPPYHWGLPLGLWRFHPQRRGAPALPPQRLPWSSRLTGLPHVTGRMGRSVNGKPPLLHGATASSNLARPTVLVAETVKALGCDPSLCGFESRRAPHADLVSTQHASHPTEVVPDESGDPLHASYEPRQGHGGCKPPPYGVGRFDTCTTHASSTMGPDTL